MKYFAGWLLAMSLVLVTGFAEARSLDFVLPDYPPHAYTDLSSESGASGLVVEIVSEALRRAGYLYDFRVLPWARGQYLVEQGEVDGICAVYRTPQRETYLDYCTVPLYSDKIYFFTTRATQIVWKGDLAALATRKLGISLAYSYGPNVDAALAGKRFKHIKSYYSALEATEALLAGVVEIVPSEKEAITAMAGSQGKAKELVKLEPPVDEVPSYIAFSKVRMLGDVRDRLDVVLKAMHADGTIAKIRKEFFGKLHAQQ